MKRSISLKLAVISGLALLLLIPVQLVTRLIHERESTRNEVVQEIGSKWANPQTVSGPVISVPYLASYTENDQIKQRLAYAHFLPEQLNIDGSLIPEERYRSLYSAVVYTAELQMNGNFSAIDFLKWNIDPQDILWDQAFISVGIPDMRGISQTVQLVFDKKTYPVDPGMPNNDVLGNGISTPITIDHTQKDYEFKLHLSLKGSEQIQFIPVGKTTKVALKSNWNDPSFSGSFLPTNRNISPQGFTADWLILHLNRNFPQQWLGSKYNIDDAAFGVDLVLPVNQYLKSERAIKYAIMFIALTFLVFFFTEILSKDQMHPIQYLMVGIGLVIFYTLLISLSEHISFNLSYLIASIAVIALITLYTKAALKNRKATLTTGSLLIALYIFLFTILQLEAYSLLMGSVGLFVALALVMYLSRKVDWNRPIKMDLKNENINTED